MLGDADYTLKFEDGSWYLCGAPHLEMSPILLDPISPSGQGFYTIERGDDGELVLREGGDIPDVKLSSVLGYDCQKLAGMASDSPEPLPIKDTSPGSDSDSADADLADLEKKAPLVTSD